MKLNWQLIASDVTAALTAVAMIPYDKDTMQIVNMIVAPQYIPWIIKGGIAATVVLRLISRFTNPKPAPTV